MGDRAMLPPELDGVTREDGDAKIGRETVSLASACAGITRQGTS